MALLTGRWSVLGSGIRGWRLLRMGRIWGLLRGIMWGRIMFYLKARGNIMINNPKVSIIIVNWDGKKHLKECLTSIFNQTYDNYEVIFVDNGSTDGSVEFVEKNYSQVKLIKLDENYGFAEGNNIGIKKAFKDEMVKYIATVNNDTKTDRHWLKELIEVAESNDKIGSCASKMLKYYDHTVIDSAGFYIIKDGGAIDRGTGELDTGSFSTKEEVFGACAGAALYRRDMLNQIGLFDEEYFAYFEDVDLAWRYRLRGWICIYVPSAIVYHKQSATGVMFSPFKTYHLQRNRLWTVVKNYPVQYIPQSIIYLIKRYLLVIYSSVKYRASQNTYASRFLNKSLKKEMVKSVIKALIAAIIGMPRMYMKRKKILSSRSVSNSEIKSWFNKFSIDIEEIILK